MMFRALDYGLSSINRGVAGDLVSIDKLSPYTEVCGTLNETLQNDEWLLLFMDTCTLKISREFIVDCRSLYSLLPPFFFWFFFTFLLSTSFAPFFLFFFNFFDVFNMILQ